MSRESGRTIPSVTAAAPIPHLKINETLNLPVEVVQPDDAIVMEVYTRKKASSINQPQTAMEG